MVNKPGLEAYIREGRETLGPNWLIVEDYRFEEVWTIYYNHHIVGYHGWTTEGSAIHVALEGKAQVESDPYYADTGDDIVGHKG